MKLDLLPNPPLKRDLCALIHGEGHPCVSPFDSTAIEASKNTQNALAARFGFQEATAWNSGVEGWFYRLLTLSRVHPGPLGVSYGLPYPAIQAAQMLQDMGEEVAFIPLTSEGFIDTRAIGSPGLLCLSLVNEDVYTQNPLERLREFHPNLPIWADLTYGALHALHAPSDYATLSGEPFGLPQDSGVFLSHTPLPNAAPLPPPGLFQAFLEALDAPRSFDDSLERLFDSLRKRLDDAVYRVVEGALPGTACLGFKGIRARNLLQALKLEGVDAINGQRCLLGHQLPSHVLRAMGRTDAEAREALSLSTAPLSPEQVESLAHTLALRYRQLTLLS